MKLWSKDAFNSLITKPFLKKFVLVPEGVISGIVCLGKITAGVIQSQSHRFTGRWNWR